MSYELWTHQFCFACDTQTDGQAYCSESCRLADNEKSVVPRSGSSSPGLGAPWSTSSSRQQTSKFFLSPAYDFSNPQPYGSTPLPLSFLAPHRASSSAGNYHVLTPSNSHTSLCSMQSSPSPAPSQESTSHASDKTKQELREYASSFEQVRLHRRRSY